MSKLSFKKRLENRNSRIELALFPNRTDQKNVQKCSLSEYFNFKAMASLTTLLDSIGLTKDTKPSLFLVAISSAILMCLVGNWLLLLCMLTLVFQPLDWTRKCLIATIFSLQYSLTAKRSSLTELFGDTGLVLTVVLASLMAVPFEFSFTWFSYDGWTSNLPLVWLLIDKVWSRFGRRKLDY